MFIGRKDSLEWLERKSADRRSLVIQGLRGVGKTRLVREWLQRSSLKARWYIAENFQSPSALLDLPLDPNVSLESAILEATKTWDSYKVIVWDDFHLLPISTRKLLIQYLSSSTHSMSHVFLSDEELTELLRAPLDSSVLKLEPLNAQEIEEYIQSERPEILKTVPPELILKWTGGLPLLLTRYVDQKDIRSFNDESLFVSLEEAEIKILRFFSVLNRSFSKQEFQSTAEVSEQTISALKRKGLLEICQRDNRELEVPAFVRNLCLKSMKAEEQAAISAAVYSHLKKDGQIADLEMSMFAIRGLQEDQIHASLSDELPEAIETLSQSDLREVVGHTRLAIERLSPTGKMQWILARVQSKAEFFLGYRDIALRTLQTHISPSLKLEANHSLSLQMGLLDLVRLLNRMGQTAKARDLAEEYFYRCLEGVQDLLKIEIAVSWLPDEPKRAKMILTQKLNKEEPFVLGNAHFQIARAFDLSSDLDLATQHYALAEKLFEDSKRPYHMCVTRLNQAWIFAKLNQWQDFEDLHRKTRPTAEQFGYQYVLAGMDLLEGLRLRSHLQLSQALHRIEQSIQRLSPSAPPGARFDSLYEWIKTLFMMGYKTKAVEHLHQLDALAPRENHNPYRARFESLHTLLDYAFGSNDEVADRTPPVGREHAPEAEELFCIDLIRGLRNPHAAPQPSFSVESKEDSQKSLSLKLAETENSLTEALARRDFSEAWKWISQFEKLLEKTPDLIIEKLALLLLQRDIATNEEGRLHCDSRIQLLLPRVSSEADESALLLEWKRCSDNNSLGQLFQSVPWQKTPSGFRDRWSRWVRPLTKSKVKQWLVVNAQERTEVDEVTPIMLPDGLTALEHLAEIYWQGKRIVELSGKYNLRKLLLVLLEAQGEPLEKESLASLVWGENYNPMIHDARIYTSVQRLRALFGCEDVLLNWSRSYRWNLKYPFVLYRQQVDELKADSRCAALILKALKEFHGQGQPWVARNVLVKLTQSSEATVKRELSKLYDNQKIYREGKGRAVVYSLSR